MTTVDDRKVSKTHVEPVESQKPMVANIDDDPVYSYREQRKIIRRIDARLIVMLGFLHTVSLIDRGNLGTAAIAGMEKELRLHGTQYVGFLAIADVNHETKRYQSTIAVAFFPPYICLQIFGPILVRKIGPTRYLSGVCFLWGAVMVRFNCVPT